MASSLKQWLRSRSEVRDRPHVYVGFDEESGREILQHIKNYRKTACRDIVHDLVRQPSDLDQYTLFRRRYALPSLPSLFCQSEIRHSTAAVD
jgi:hypothetical protein